MDCYIYLLVHLIEDKRIYVTAVATTTNKSIIGDIGNYMLANEGDIECKSYSIGSSTFDTLFKVTNFQGDADFFLAKRT